MSNLCLLSKRNLDKHKQHLLTAIPVVLLQKLELESEVVRYLWRSLQQWWQSGGQSFAISESWLSSSPWACELAQSITHGLQLFQCDEEVDETEVNG